MHLVNKNKKVKVWYCRFTHASNARIVRTSKLLNSMGDFNKKYNSTEIYSNYKQSDSNDNANSDQPVPWLDDNANLNKPEAKCLQPSNLSLAMFSVLATMDSDFDSLYTPCIASK